MDPIKEIEALKGKLDALEQAVAAPGISEAKEIAIHDQITAVERQITMWGGKVRPSFREKLWETGQDHAVTLAFGGAAMAYAWARRYMAWPTFKSACTGLAAGCGVGWLNIPYPRWTRSATTASKHTSNPSSAVRPTPQAAPVSKMLDHSGRLPAAVGDDCDALPTLSPDSSRLKLKQGASVLRAAPAARAIRAPADSEKKATKKKKKK